MNESSVRAGLLFLLVVPVCLIVVTDIVYNISNAITGQYSFTFSREYVGWQTGDGAVIVWIPTFITGLFLELFPFIILVRAYLLRSSTKHLNPLKDPEILTIAGDAAVIAGIDLPPLYVFEDQRPLLDVLGTNKKPFLRFSSAFIDSFRKKPKKLKALLLHEYSHILNRDMELLALRLNFIHVLRLYLFFGFCYQCFNMYLYAKEHVEIPPSEMGTRILFLTFRNQFVLFMALLFLYLLVNSIYREREFLADRKANSMMNVSILGSALEDLENMIPRGVNIEILSDHPSLQKRIDNLETPRRLTIPLVLWTAFTLAFVALVVTHVFSSLALSFYQDNTHLLEEFYESIGIWIYFGIDVVFPVLVILYMFRIQNSVKSFVRFVGKSSLCCGIYLALVVGYHFTVSMFRSLRIPIPEVATISNRIYFEWSHMLLPKLFREPGVILMEKMVMLDLPMKLQTALQRWVFGFSVMFYVCTLMGILICVMQKSPISKIRFSSGRGRLLVVVGIQILLISGFMVVQIPREDRASTMEEWIMSYYRAPHEQDPNTGEHVRVGRFDFYANYDIENTYYAIHILKCVVKLDTLTLNQRDELIRWLKFHQDDNGEFFTGFYFEVRNKARIQDEYYILSSLKELDALNIIDSEGAIQYAMSEFDDNYYNVFYLAEILSLLNALGRVDLLAQFPTEDYQIECSSENGNCYDRCIQGLRFCYEGFRSCARKGGCLSCTYWSVSTLEKLNEQDMYDGETVANYILEHYTEGGGFCEEIKVDWLSEPPKMYKQGFSDLKSTFYAVKSLETLDKLNIDRERTLHHIYSCQMRDGTVRTLEVMDQLSVEREMIIQYVLSCQTREGGFTGTPQGEPTFEDTYYAVEILDALDSLDRLRDLRSGSDVLLEIFHSLPLIAYILAGTLIVIDLWLYCRVRE